MSDPDNAGFSGIRDNYLADIIETGTSSYTGQVSNGPYLNSYPADVILLHIGTNDVWATDYSVNDVARLLDAVDDYENSSGHPILVFLARIISRRDHPCGTDAGIVAYNSNLISMAQSRINSGDLISIVDMECGAGLDYSNDLMDQLHPNQTGYEKMADKWFEAINSYNSTPQLTQIPDQAADRGQSFSQISLDNYINDAEDDDNEIVWTFYPSSPEHFSVSIDANRKVTVTPNDPNWSGTETIEFVATDNGSVIPALKKSVSCLTQFTVNWTPEIIGQQPISTSENNPLELLPENLVIIEPDKAPAGMVVEANNGDNYTVQGSLITPDQNFSGTLFVPVKLIAGSKESNLYTLTIQVQDVNHQPLIISSPVVVTKSGLEYIYDIVATDEDPGDVLTYSAVQKPSWLHVNASSGRVSGIPSQGDIGLVDITVKVSDGAEEDTQSYTLEVQYYNVPPEVVTTPKDTIEMDHTYSYGIQAVDVEDDPLTYFAKTLPGWLSFFPETQVLIGIPEEGNVGENLVVLGVSDQQDTTYQVFIIQVTFISKVSDPEYEETIRIYPNPVSDQMIIDLADYPQSSGELLFEAMDLTGKIVLSKELVSSHTEIGMWGKGFQDGYYLFRITDTGRKMIIKSGKILFKATGK